VRDLDCWDERRRGFGAGENSDLTMSLGVDPENGFSVIEVCGDEMALFISCSLMERWGIERDFFRAGWPLES
jgi:hypothetical protein